MKLEELIAKQSQWLLPNVTTVAKLELDNFDYLSLNFEKPSYFFYGSFAEAADYIIKLNPNVKFIYYYYNTLIIIFSRFVDINFSKTKLLSTLSSQMTSKISRDLDLNNIVSSVADNTITLKSIDIDQYNINTPHPQISGEIIQIADYNKVVSFLISEQKKSKRLAINSLYNSMCSKPKNITTKEKYEYLLEKNIDVNSTELLFYSKGTIITKDEIYTSFDFVLDKEDLIDMI